MTTTTHQGSEGGPSLANDADAEKRVSANHILRLGQDALSQRAALRDSCQGERSIAKAVQLFNVWTGRDLTESEGWRFQIALKMAREIQGQVHMDDYVDGASYFALLGESECNTSEKQTPSQK